MKLTVLTADSAQVDRSGKVHALGLGWDRTPTPLPSFALIVFVDTDVADKVEETVDLVGALLDGQGNPVRIDPDENELRLRTSLELSREVSRAIAVVVLGPGMPLQPGRYHWMVSVEGYDVSEQVVFDVHQSGLSSTE